MEQKKNNFDKAKAYQRKKQGLTLFHLVLTPAVLLLVISTPLALLFKEWASVFVSNSYLTLGLFFFFFSLFMLIFDVPFSFYSSFTIEHQFKLSNQSLGAWWVEFIKKSVLSFLLSLALLEGLYALIWRFPDRWWILAWAGYAVVSYVLGKLFPVVIIPLFYKYSKVEDNALKERIFSLAKRYGLPVENVYQINLSKTTKKANAAFMGLGKTKRVVLSDTLLADFTGDEIETVVAHELGHFKHRDIWKQLGFGMVVSWILFWVAFHLMDPMASLFGFEGVRDVASLPLLFLIIYFFRFCSCRYKMGFRGS